MRYTAHVDGLGRLVLAVLEMSCLAVANFDNGPVVLRSLPANDLRGICVHCFGLVVPARL